MTTVDIRGWTGPVDPQHPDANFLDDVAAYARVEPLRTLEQLGENVGVPVGGLVHYVLAKWASGGSEALLEIGPSTVQRLAAQAEQVRSATDPEERSKAVESLVAMVEWLALPLQRDDIYGS